MRSDRLVVGVNTPSSRNANQRVQDPGSTRPLTTNFEQRDRPEATSQTTESSQQSSQEIVTELIST